MSLTWLTLVWRSPLLHHLSSFPLVSPESNQIEAITEDVDLKMEAADARPAMKERETDLPGKILYLLGTIRKEVSKVD